MVYMKNMINARLPDITVKALARRFTKFYISTHSAAIIFQDFICHFQDVLRLTNAIGNHEFQTKL